ncbi:MAG: hypothetical protein MUF21_03705 [Gemmatimonadaceae bacterium]|nr:hypothetical protein [Gemmatimonadaceae bacterium]
MLRPPLRASLAAALVLGACAPARPAPAPTPSPTPARAGCGTSVGGDTSGRRDAGAAG